MKRFHISISVDDFAASIADYSERLGTSPSIVKDNRYALWRTDTLNFSISQKPDQPAGLVRHIGFEDDDATGFSESTDVNGIIWETFSKETQAAEIRDKIPGATVLKDE